MTEKTPEYTKDYEVNGQYRVKMAVTELGRMFIPEGEDIGGVTAEPLSYEETDKDREILTTASANLVAARAFPLPVVEVGSAINSRWFNWQENIFLDSQKMRTCQEALHHAQSNIPFDHREPFDEKKDTIYSLLLGHEFPTFKDSLLKFGDNPKSLPDTIQSVDGIVKSNILYWHLRALCFCSHFVSGATTVAEIGGGYGGLARLWLHHNKVKKYVIIDIPEALFFAEVALRAEFGDRVGYWNGSDPGTQLVLLPITRLHEFKQPLDLVVNTGSMQEMSDQWVSFYMGWLDGSGARFFYSLNYMAQPIQSMFESRTFWAPRPNPAWLARLINAEPTLIKLMSIGRDFSDVLYEKTGPLKKLSDWSVLNGDALTRQSYLEGLELLRHDFSIQNGVRFVDTLVAYRGYPFQIPKELLFLCGALRDANVRKFDHLFKRMDTVEKMMCI